MPNVSAVRSSLFAIARFGFVAMASAMGFTLPSQAAVLHLGPLTFSEASGDFVLTGGSFTGLGFVLEQEVYGPNINLFIAIDGLRSACPGRGGCLFPVQSIVRNSTGTPWLFFDHELQEIYGIASPEEDGLSFAQELTRLEVDGQQIAVRPFISNRLAGADEVTDVRDFVNFSGGTVAPGDSVTFNYWISDTTPLNRFYLLQRPNFQVGGVGFVNPAPLPVNPPSTPISEPVVEPITEPTPEPVVEPVTERPNPVVSVDPPPNPQNSAAVPEPSSILGLLLAGAIAGKMRLKTSR